MESKSSSLTQLAFTDIRVKAGSKQILNNVSGEVNSGQILAVMGPSGSGKTTLLNAVAGRLAINSGEITLNGTKLTKRLRKRMCYVTQEDVFLSNLTLRETLYFYAMIRLPDKMAYSEKMSRLQEIIDVLDLQACQHTRMGDSTRRGLSGGEKKRASIGCELLTDPDIMLLDEPTTGLDSSMALTLMTLLKRYADGHHKTILLTIHQPSSQVYYMFSRLMLLAQGKVAYYGPANQALAFFEEAGLPCTPHYNPADFMLHTLKRDEHILQRLFILSQQQHTKPIDMYDTGQQILSGDASFVSPTKSDYQETESSHHWQTCFWTQFKMLVWRTFKQSRSRILAHHTILSTFIVAVVVGIVWFQSPRNLDSVRDRMGLIFFTIGHMGFLVMFDGVISFSEERPVVLKERGAGTYRVSAMYLAKLFSELPLSFTLPVGYFSISYWMAGLRSEAGIFFTALALLILHCLVCKGIGFMVGPGVWKMQLAITVTSTSMVSLALCGGFFATLFPPWLVWTRYLSVFGHTLSAMSLLEFGDMTPIPCTNVSLENYPQCGWNGTDFVTPENLLYELGTVLPIYIYISALAGMVILFFVTGYIIFRFKGRVKT